MRKFVGRIHFEGVAELHNGAIVLACQGRDAIKTEIDAEREGVQFPCLIDLAKAPPGNVLWPSAVGNSADKQWRN